MPNARRLVRAVVGTCVAITFASVSAQTPPVPTDSADHTMSERETMPGLYGRYTMSREASGTSWQPAASPHDGQLLQLGEWSGMVHGSFQYVSTEQRGPRGATDTYTNNMLMAMLSRPIGEGRLGVRTMLSLEPETVGTEGYPLLLQSGETADGFSHLLDRQHPHDTFMELATTYSRPIGAASSFFVYGALSGEPAIGPPAFMHRFSGMEFPESPITHHWLDSTHITYRVLTTGIVIDAFKIEASAFRGREPDQYRWDLERGTPDSYSVRLSWNPSPNWSLQFSTADIESPEQIAPTVNTRRTTASAIYHRSLGNGESETLLAWGRNDNEPGNTLDALLIESIYRLRDRHNLLGRLEWAQKDELAPHVHIPGQFTVLPETNVSRISLGYIFDFLSSAKGRMGVGILINQNYVPDVLEPIYGGDPTAYSVFLRGRF